ncbi:hypothetical protein M422DRAFT_773968, partial [Sphaerobolus stellatus SS14]
MSTTARISSTLHSRCPSHPASPRRPLIPNHRIILCGRQTRRRPKASRSPRRPLSLHVPIPPRLAPACLEPSDYTPEFCRALKKIYWKSCSISKPWYGANMKGSLFTPSLTTWSVSQVYDQHCSNPTKHLGHIQNVDFLSTAIQGLKWSDHHFQVILLLDKEHTS